MSEEKLIDNLLLTFPNTLEGLTKRTRDQILKERIALSLDKIIEHLNETYPDVHFYALWTSSMFEDALDQRGMSLKHGFDEHEQSDSDYYGYMDDEDDEAFWGLSQAPLNELAIKLTFIRTQECNLGHSHRNKRFYYYSIPRIMEVISVYLHDPNWKDDFVKKHVPNFFEIEQ